MSKRADSSPIFESLIGLKSTNTSSLSSASRRPRKTPSALFCGCPLMNSCVVRSSRPAFFDLDVNVRRPAGIRHWLDGAKAILALRSGGELPEALEVCVASVAALLKVHTLAVALPDFNDGVVDRLPAEAEHPAGQVRDLADGR